MNQSDHYLLTGASGFLGSVINKLLIENGFKVTRLDQPVKVDLRNPFSFDSHFEPDVVVHAAGKAHIFPRTPEEEQAFYDVNFGGTKNLCAALETLHVKPGAFIFISTVAVYGLDSGNMITEDHPLNGETPYAKSKINAEKWLAQWAGKNNIRLGILRLPLVAGLNPPGNLGAMINGIRSGRYLSIGKATARKSMVWHEDVATVIPILSKISGTFNLTDRRHPSFKELESVISAKLGKKIPFTVPFYLAKLLARAGDILGPRSPFNSDKLKKLTATLTFDDNKACEILGWQPSPVLDKFDKELV